MKQHITKEQWDEINLDTQGKIIQSVNISADGMTIGQMIEFLGDDLTIIEYYKETYTAELDKFIYSEYQFESKELADALWEAVKAKLNK